MKRALSTWVPLAILLVVSGLTLAVSASGIPGKAQMTQRNSGGGVQVTVTFLNPTDPGTLEDLAFALVLDTHAGDLSTYDVAAQSVLTNDRGETIAAGFTWRADQESGHHRKGQLQVKNQTASGEPFWDSGTKVVALELKNLAGVPVRRFEWRFAAGG